MNEKEMQGLIQNALLKTLKEFEENPDNVFNNLELQEKYNGVLKDKIQLQQENRELKKQLEKCKEVFDKLKKLIVGNQEIQSEESGFYDAFTDYITINVDELLEILKEVE